MRALDRDCEWCGGIVILTRSHRRFCNAACRAASWRAAHRRGARRCMANAPGHWDCHPQAHDTGKDPHERRLCLKVIDADRPPHTRWCSQACRNREYRRRRGTPEYLERQLALARRKKELERERARASRGRILRPRDRTGTPWRRAG